MKEKFLVLILAVSYFQSSFSQDINEEWKLFKSKEHQFSIGFPDNCIVISTGGPLSESWKENLKEKGQLRFSFDLLKYSVTFANKVFPLYSLSIYSNPRQLNLEDFIYKIIIDDMTLYKKSDISIKPFEIENFQAFIANYENEIGGYTGIKSELFIQRENEIFRLELHTDIDNQYDQIFYKIIKTINIEY